jgi:thioredoxin 1
MDLLTVTDEAQFERVVLQSDVPALVDFRADWCAPCRMMAPVLAHVASLYPDSLQVVKVNVDDCPDIAHRYGVTSIPFLVVCRGHEVLRSLPGVRPKQVLLNELQAAVGPASAASDK